MLESGTRDTFGSGALALGRLCSTMPLLPGLALGVVVAVAALFVQSQGAHGAPLGEFGGGSGLRHNNSNNAEC